MNVLHFYRTYYPETQGGLEESIRQICLATARQGIKSRILTLASDPSPAVVERPEGRVIRGQRQLDPASCSMGWSSFAQYRAEARHADVINLHYPWPFADLVHFASRCDKPVVLTYHSDIVRQRWLNTLYSPLRSWLLNSATAIIATSPNYLKSSPVLQRYADKVTVIPLGVDGATCEPADEAARQQVMARHPRDFFLFVGVLRYYKGLRYLVEAVRGAPYDVVIAGSGPIEEELRRQVAESGVHNLHLVGQISNREKAALMERSRGIVFPSHLRSEAFGVTLVEGAMFGKPLISTDIGTGTSYVNQHGETGLVVPPADPPALRAAMDALWQDPARAQVMGSRARARYEQQFSGNVLGARYSALYRQVYDQDGRGGMVRKPELW